MKRPWIKWGILGIGVLAAVVGVPIIINECYKANCGYITLWSAEDVLAYYGALVASVGAAAGVFVSIKAASKNYQEDVRARVLPFIAVTTFERKATVNTMALMFEQVEKKSPQPDQAEAPAVRYEEYKLERIYFIITESGIEVRNKLDKRQQSILDNAGNMWSTVDGVSILQRIEYYSLPVEIENIGNGTAVELRIGFNRKESGNQHGFLHPMMLKQGQNLYIHIFSTESYEAVKGEYVLECHYADIYGNSYSQEFPVECDKNKDGQKCMRITLVGKQTHKMEGQNNAHT